MAVEFSRNITFGQYLDLRSPIHRLDPRTKIAVVGILMITTFLTRTPISALPLYLCAALIQIISRVPLSYTLRGMRLLVGTLLVITVFQVLFFQNAPPEHILWRWWLLSISWDGLRQGLLLLLRVVLLYYWTSTLMLTTTMMDLADGMEVLLDPLKRLRVPVNELVMTMVIAIKFVPLLVAELERLVKAQTARGARFDKGGPIQRTRRLASILVPLFVNAFNRAETLTTAMNARCYRGGQGRTKRRLLTFRRIDALALSVTLIFTVSTVIISQFGG